MRAVAPLIFILQICIFAPFARAEVQVKAEDCSSAVSGTMIGSKVEIHCLSKEDITRVVDELVRQGVVRRAGDVGIETPVIASLAARLRPTEKLDFAQAVTEVSHAVDIAVKVVTEGASGSSDQLVDEVLKRIAERTKANDPAGATREAEEGFARWEEKETERRASALATGVALLEAALKTDLLRFDATSAAGRVEKIASLQQGDDPKAFFKALRARQDQFYVEGSDKGVNFSLEVAIAIARLEVARAHGPDEHGVALNDLGIALETLGERESGTGKLTEAVAAYRAALEERTRARVPLDWARTQNNLGNALTALGERESGTGKLTEAVAAYRAALEEWTRERVPLDWAMAQNNLGTALERLGERESGTGKLTEAVAAYRAALEEWTRERVPLDWAATQMNLGNALTSARGAGEWDGEAHGGGRGLSRGAGGMDARARSARLGGDADESRLCALEARGAGERDGEARRGGRGLSRGAGGNDARACAARLGGDADNLGNALERLGERESGTGKLTEAVAAYRAALEEYTRERVPLQWAATQINLGNALAMLGERESGTGKLTEAVAAYRAALEEYTRERVPLQWAVTQNNLGNALKTLGERESGTGKLTEAVAAYRAALEERTRERVPLDWAATQINLGNALERLGERESGTGKLTEAVAAYRAALEEMTRERVPLEWAMTQINLGNALRTLGERESGTGKLTEAVVAYRAALEEWTPQTDPTNYQLTTKNLNQVLTLLKKKSEKKVSVH